MVNIINGTAGPDVINGTIDVDEIHGKEGDDVLYRVGANDVLYGEEGNDYLAAPDATAYGGPGDDTYYYGGETGGTIIENPGEGNDTIITAQPFFYIGTSNGSANVENLSYIGSANFLAYGSSADNRITGGFRGDLIYGYDGADVLIGNDGDDTLVGGPGGGSLDGGNGNDVLWFEGATALIGGDGFDHAIQQDNTGLTRALGATGIEVYVGANGADVLDTFGAPTSMIVYGGGGADLITMGENGGYAFGQTGADTLIGGIGVDVLLGGADNDSISGGGGNDVLYVDAQDSFDGGAGVDYAIVDTSAAVTVDLSARNIEVFVGNTGNDTINAAGATGPMGLYGYDGNDVITDGAGGSQLFGQAGNDVLNGNAGNDVIIGGAGSDQLFGGDGNDQLYVDAFDGYIGGAGFDRLFLLDPGGAYVNLQNTSIEWASGDSGNDTIIGLGAPTSIELYGNGGNDSLFGGDNSDYLYGGSGDDTLQDQSGTNWLFGGAGSDHLITVLNTNASTNYAVGESDADYFTVQSTAVGIPFYVNHLAVNGAGVVTDFQQGTDVIEFKGMPGVDAFNDVVISRANGNTIVTLDASWQNATFDEFTGLHYSTVNSHVVLTVYGTFNLTASDFLFSQ